MMATKTKTKTKKKESDYAPVFKLLKGIAPGNEVWVENEFNTIPFEELNRISMAVRRGPVSPRKGHKWSLRSEEGTVKNPHGYTVISLKKA